MLKVENADPNDPIFPEVLEGEKDRDAVSQQKVKFEGSSVILYSAKNVVEVEGETRGIPSNIHRKSIEHPSSY